LKNGRFEIGCIEIGLLYTPQFPSAAASSIFHYECSSSLRSTSSFSSPLSKCANRLLKKFTQSSGDNWKCVLVRIKFAFHLLIGRSNASREFSRAKKLNFVAERRFSEWQEIKGRALNGCEAHLEI